MSDPQAALKAFEPKHEFFVGVDSDGCTFDTMEVKHKYCFVVAVLQAFGLAALARILRDVWDFVNLNSKSRGCNRWLALRATFQHLIELTPYERFKGFLNAHLNVIEDFIKAADETEDIHLSNEGLLRFAATRLKTPSAKILTDCIVADPVGVAMSPMGRKIVEADTDPESCLIRLIFWTHLVNGLVAIRVFDVPPFPYVRESLAFLADKADMIVVSATPVEALTREWEEHDIARYVRVIAGQEMGKKRLHLELAAKGKYAPDHVLMVGDAPGDLRAAKANGALFYPINPGEEEASWQRFYEEAMHKFLAGEYAGAYEQSLIEAFEALLPDVPPWKR